MLVLGCLQLLTPSEGQRSYLRAFKKITYLFVFNLSSLKTG